MGFGASQSEHFEQKALASHFGEYPHIRLLGSVGREPGEHASGTFLRPKSQLFPVSLVEPVPGATFRVYDDIARSSSVRGPTAWGEYLAGIY